MLERDDLSQESGPPCCITGCDVRESGAGSTCVIWGGKRMCYRHFAAFHEHQLSTVCSDRGSGPTPAEWAVFVTSVTREEVTQP